MLQIYIFFALVVCWFLHQKLKTRRLTKMMQQFNGPPMLPLVGNGLHFVGEPSAILQRAMNLCGTYGSPSRLWILNKPYVIVYSPEDFQTIAFKTLQKDDNYKFIAEMLGNGIFTSEVQKWKIHRRLLNAAFNPFYLKDFLVDIFNKKSLELVQILEQRADFEENFDLWPYFIQTSIETISETALGYEEENTTELSPSIFGNAVIKSALLVSKRFYQPWLQPSILFTIYKYLTGYGKYFKIVREFPLKMLASRRQKLNSNLKNNCNESSFIDAMGKKNFVGILLESYDQHHLTNQELKDEVTSIMFGGSETNAVTACFLLLMLGMQQDVQDKVYAELYDVFGDSTRNIQMDDMTNLSFLEQCIKETLRRFPVVPFISRHANEDIPIKNGLIIPAGVDVILNILGIHLDPKIYQNPFIWNPDNFNPKNVSSRHKSSFVPFSTGPRACIGQKYAWVFLKTQISVILRKFKVYTDVKMEDIELTIDLIIRSRDGYKVRLERRIP